ncbi:MAG: S26 family signal peptidase [Actinobacteria bacterium]|nr:S26 family signal peptidase [Actinomycetota bacterium]
MTTTPLTAVLPDADVTAPVTLEGDVAGARSSSGRRMRSALGWLLLAVAIVALWPAQWGGITGLTIVSGQSMEPAYHTGDLVVTIRQPGYAVGDVISYRVPAGQPGAGGRVIHRIESIQAGVLRTLGDNNSDTDPWVFTAADITGRAIFHLPGVGLLWSPTVLPLILAAIAGLAVTVLLWPAKPERQASLEDADHA